MMMTNNRKIMILGLVAMGFMAALSPAEAQVPGSVTVEATQQNDVLPDVLDIGDPCPEPRQALANTPNDLKNIQEDITRFTLCLQRAQLLTRLNELSIENLDTINSTLDEKMMGFIETMEPPEMPVIEMPAQPEMPDVESIAAPALPESYVPESMPVTAPEPAVVEPAWMIREVTGRGGELIAVLVDDADNLTHVKQGDTIPDTDLRVQSVTPTSVTVRMNDETMKLGWVNN